MYSALLGNPVEHSISDELFEYLNHNIGVLDEYKHKKILVDSVCLEDKIKHLINDPKCIGLNITLPYKREVMRYIDNLDRVAEITGSVNNIYKSGNIITGTNTDWKGIYNSILKYIDYDLFKQKSPIFIGYSDTTALALALYNKTGCITYLSQSVISNFGEFEPFNELNYFYFDFMLQSKCETLMVQIPDVWTDEWINWETYEKTKKTNKNEWIIFNKGEFNGTLIGGNLDTIVGIIGTEYMPKITEDTILLLEDVYTDLGRLYRNFTTLALHGIFDKIGGLIISKFETIGENSDVINDIINEFVGHRKIPILLNFDYIRDIIILLFD